MSRDHAILAPSSAARWIDCPGSIRMSAGITEPQTDAAAEGELAHAVCEATLLGTTMPTDATEEMIDGAIIYADYVRSVAPIETAHVEERVAGVHPENWGTPDLWHLTDDTLHVFDYKFGYGVVEPYRNWQLLNYAAGIIGKTPDMMIHLHIIQPRAYHRRGVCRSWSITSDGAFLMFDQLASACIEAMREDASTYSGEYCNHCPGRYRCPTLLKTAYSIIDRSGESLPLDLAADVMGFVLAQVRDSIERLEAIESGLEQQVLSVLRGGARVPGWHLETGAGREKWRVPYEEVVALGDAMGVDVRKPGLITPKQSVKAGLPRDLVDSFTETPTGKVSVVRDDARLSQVFGAK